MLLPPLLESDESELVAAGEVEVEEVVTGVAMVDMCDGCHWKWAGGMGVEMLRVGVMYAS